MPARSFRSLIVFLAVSLFPLSPAFADLLTGVSVSGSVSGSGDLNALLGCPAYFPISPLDQSYSFSGSNSQTGVGNYSLGKSGSVACEENVNYASADQSADVTGKSFMVTDEVSAATAGGPGFLENANASSSLTLSFDLNQAALVDFSESFNTFCGFTFLFFPGQTYPGPCSSQILPYDMANATGSVELMGPGGNVPLLPSFILGPGDYTLNVSGSASAMTLDIPFEGYSWLSLDAEFTAIPEPRWLAGMAVILLVGLHGARRMAARS